MAAGLLVSGRSSCERGAGLVVCERQRHLPWAAPSPGEKGSLRGFTEKVIPVEDKEQLQGEHGVGDEQARWGAGCKKAQEILSSMMCCATVSDFARQVLGGVPGSGASRSPL